MSGDHDLAGAVAAELAGLRDDLRTRRFGRRLGMVAAPALLVVDLIRAFTDPRSPPGAPLDAEVEVTRALVDRCHALGAPVFFTTMEYDEALTEARMFGRKAEHANRVLIRGSEWVALDERLGARPADGIVVKKYPSAFWGTDLASRLVSRGLDTVVSAGCTTSGCVRASAVDACSLVLRPIVVEDAVGDRAPLSHLTSLFDIDFKYGDVASSAEVLDELGRLGP